MEFLLVDGGGGESCGFDASEKPFGGVAVCVAELLDGLLAHVSAWVVGVAYGYHAGDFFFWGELVCAFDFAVGDACPAGAQTELLGEKDYLLSPVAYAVVEVGGFFTSHDEVVFYACEAAVCHDSVEAFFLVEDELYV